VWEGSRSYKTNLQISDTKSPTLYIVAEINLVHTPKAGKEAEKGRRDKRSKEDA
jgi:hypothetical protein